MNEITRHPVVGPNKEPLSQSYRWMIEEGPYQLCPWELLTNQKESDNLSAEYRKEVALPNSNLIKDIIVFARRLDNDDVAGFIIKDDRITERVLSVHLTWSAKPESDGWPASKEYPNIWEWIRSDAVSCMMERAGFSWTDDMLDKNV